MTVWPSWLWLTSPLKFWLWLANRLATWTGLFYLWKRFRLVRHFWIWFTLVNTLSMGALVLVFFWLHRRVHG